MSSARAGSGPMGQESGGLTAMRNFLGKITVKIEKKFAKKGRKYLTTERRYDNVKKSK